ncbi:MAG TPA: M48 family metalloprotease [Solirubrobacteraceae bacterium]
MLAYAPAGSRAGVALALAVGAAQGASLLLRPREGLIEPEPVRAEEHFSAAELERARAYRRGQRRLGLAALGVETGLLAALTARPPRFLARTRPAAAGAALSVATALAPLPVRVVAHRRAIGVGLVTQSWAGWAVDLAKSSAIGGGIAAAGAALADGLRRRMPRAWWLPGAGAVVGAAGAAIFAAPVLLDPLFNRFRPMTEGPLRRDILELADRAGVRVGEVYVVDASRRTTAANAYVTGLGATKRVVLFDTLVEHFTPDETRLVVAHELAHVRFRDVHRSLAFTALVAPFGAFAVAALAPPRPGAAALPGLALAAGVVAAPVGVVANALSRRVEARADAFALRLTKAPEPFVSFERRITVRNVADPDPPRLLRALFATHPSTVERIGIARGYASGRG